MKLKEWIKQYRESRGYSLQDMAEVCGVSKSFLASLERGINPSTNKPYSVTLDTARKIAAGTHRNVEELAAECEDVHLPAGFQSINDDEEKILSSYRRLNLNNKQMFRQLLSTFIAAQSAGITGA